MDLPPLSGMSHIGQVILIIPHILHSGKSHLEVRGYGIGPGTVVRCTEIEIAANPLRMDIHEIVEAGIFRRGLDVLGFQGGLDQFIPPSFYFLLDGLRDLGLRRFGRAVDPALLASCHLRSSLRKDCACGGLP